MKKFTIIFVLALLLTACQSGQTFGPTLNPSPTFTLTPTVTATPAPTPSYTPTPIIEKIIVGEPSNNKSYFEGLVLSELSYLGIDPESFKLVNTNTSLVTGGEGSKVLVDHFLDPQDEKKWKGAGIAEKTMEAIFNIKYDQQTGQTKGTSKWGTVIRLDLYTYLTEDGRKLVAVTNKGFPLLFEQDGKLMFGAIGEDYLLDKGSIRPAFETLNEMVNRLAGLGYSGNESDVVSINLEKATSGFLTGRIQVIENKGIRFLQYIGIKPSDWQTPFYSDFESLSNDLVSWLKQGVCNTPYNEIRFINGWYHRGYLYQDNNLAEFDSGGALEGGISLTVAPRFFGFLRLGDGVQYAVFEACDVNNRPFVWIGVMGLTGDPKVGLTRRLYRSAIKKFFFDGKLLEGGFKQSISSQSNDAIITEIRPEGQVYTHVDGFDPGKFEFRLDFTPEDKAFLKIHMPREYVLNIADAYSGVRKEELGAVAWTIDDLVNLDLNQTPLLGDISYTDK